MKQVAYVSPFVPVEWIAAHGLRPRRLLPSAAKGRAAGAAPMGVCPFAWAFVQSALADEQIDAVVAATTCDQMRRLAERIADSGKPCFLMHVPTSWQTAATREYYYQELLRLGRFLETLGGCSPAPEVLTALMRRYEAARESWRRTRSARTAWADVKALLALDADGEFSNTTEAARSEGGVPLALLGDALLIEDEALFDVVARAGGRIVIDASGSGERILPAPPDETLLASEPLRALAAAYFTAIPDAFRRPNTPLYDWLEPRLHERGVRGIILRTFTWCDTWRAEAQRLAAWSPMPVLTLSTDADEALSAHARSRLESFIEMLA